MSYLVLLFLQKTYLNDILSCLILLLANTKKENRFLEFKSNYQSPEKLGQYISALSNGACLDHVDYGYLFFGVEDKILKIKGTIFDWARENVKNGQSLELYLRLFITPCIPFQID